MIEVSAGGVVFNKGRVLILKRRDGGWVLPKGHVELGEDFFETALREVKEETNINAIISTYIDKTQYKYYNEEHEKFSRKTVYWFKMLSEEEDPKPLSEEGFIDAIFTHLEDAISKLIHEKERQILVMALEMNEEDK